MNRIERTKKEADKLLTAIISGCKSRDGTSMECEPIEVSKIVYERYTNAELGSIKLFKYSSGKTGNNKPFLYNVRVNQKKFYLIDDCLLSLMKDEKEDDGIDKLLEFNPMEDLKDG